MTAWDELDAVLLIGFLIVGGGALAMMLWTNWQDWRRARRQKPLLEGRGEPELSNLYPLRRKEPRR